MRFGLFFAAGWFWLAILVIPVFGEDTLPAVVAGKSGNVSQTDYARVMVDGMHRFLARQTEAAVAGQEAFFQRDFSSLQAYDRSLEKNRQRLAFLLGIRDRRCAPETPEPVGTLENPGPRWRGDAGAVYGIRVRVLDDFVTQALLYEPARAEVAEAIILVPDAETEPEVMLAEFLEKHPDAHGSRIVVMTTVSRRVEKYGGARLSQREYVYRSAFVMGRHIIGYEVQSVFAVLDWLRQDKKSASAAIKIVGREDGAMVAFYAAALDTRIGEAWLSGYFEDRARLWEQPIDRNVFGLLECFGDAQLAMMVFPRKLVLDDGDVQAKSVDRGSAGAPGSVWPIASESERRRLREILDAAGEAKTLLAGEAWPVWQDAQKRKEIMPPPYALPQEKCLQRQRKIVAGMQQHTQHLLARAAEGRKKYMGLVNTQNAGKLSLAELEKQQAPYREYFAQEVIGDFAQPLAELNPRVTPFMRNAYFTGYEVVLDVFEDVIAYGILLVPHGISPGQRRPVVVTQTGLEARAVAVLAEEQRPDFGGQNSYRGFGSRLAEKGYIVFSPQHPYLFQDHFRQLQRRANPLKKTLFSLMVPQHRQIVKWLATREDVDAEKIAFYGLSYGGKSAMRIPPLVPEYCLAICSADFNEWVMKNASELPFSYLYKNEYEIFEWNLGNTFNYAEMAALIAPRPFMVERGNQDAVGWDEYVAFEYAKVRHLYQNRLGIPERTEIEFHEHGHIINAKKTFEFLDRFLMKGE